MVYKKIEIKFPVYSTNCLLKNRAILRLFISKNKSFALRKENSHIPFLEISSIKTKVINLGYVDSKK